MRARVVERFDVVVDRNGYDARFAGDVATDHEHDTELSQRVGEAQHSRGKETGRGQRHRDGEKCVELRGAERAGRLDLLPAEGVERALQRLHRERQAVEAGGNDESRERERQGFTGHLDPPAADRAVRPEDDEQVKAHDRWRQDDRQRHDRLDRRLQPRPGA